MKTNGFKERVARAFDALLPFCQTISLQSRYLDKKILGLVPNNCRRALDIGCGYGEFPLKLADLCKYVVGYDLSPAMIKEARERLRAAGKTNVEFIQADCDTVPETFKNAGFVVCIRSIHYLAMEEFLRRITATAPSGCRVAIVGVLKKYCRHPLCTLVLEMLFYLFHPRQLVKFFRDFGWRTFVNTHKSKYLMDRHPLWREHIDRFIFEGMLLSFPKYDELYRRLLPGCVVDRMSVREFLVTWQKP